MQSVECIVIERKTNFDKVFK